MSSRFRPIVFSIVAIIFSLCLNTSAQQTVQNDPLSSQKDCVNCQNELGSAPSLGSAANYAVLGSSTVTSTGMTVLTGNIGVSPGTSITGFGPGTVAGSTNAGTPLAAQAQADSAVAYNALAVQGCDVDLSGIDLGGLVLVPGVYCFDATAQLSGILTLDGLGNPNAVFVFQIGSTLTTAVASSVVLINQAKACNVFYQVGSSATIGTATAFRGTLIAFTSITLNAGSSILGRAIALNGAVTMDTNSVTRCNIAPSAAAVNLGGRVVTPEGNGIPLALITMSDGAGVVRMAYTSTFGYYTFDNVVVGQTVILTVSHKGDEFAEPSLVISLFDEITTADFTAN